MRRLKQTLSGAAYLAVWRLIRLLPERVALGLGERMALRSWRRNQRLRDVVTANLAPVVAPEALSDTVKDAFRSYARYWIETFRMQDLSDAELDARLDHEGAHILDEVFASGTGGVAAVPHIGNWDAGGRWACKRWRLTVVAEVLKPRMVFERFLKHRRALGMTVIGLERGKDVVAQCERFLSEGDIVALVCDRDLSERGVEVKMFGRTTTLPAGPAVLAARRGVPLIPATIFQQPGGRWLVSISEPVPQGLPVQETMQHVADVFASMIARHPEQWHVFAGRYWRDG